MTSWRAFWRTFRRDERGTVALMLTPMMIVLVGMVAFSVDTMYAITTREQLRTTAEAAVAAAVAKLPDKVAARAAGLAYAQVNFKGTNPGDIVLDADIEFGMWDSADRTFTVVAAATAANAVRVSANRTLARGNPLETFFGEALGVTAFDLVVTAIAARPGGAPCIVVLHPTASEALKVDSNATIESNGCGIHVHSNHTRAMVTDSNAHVTVTDAEICIKGNYQRKSNSTISPTPTTGCTPKPDPFASLAAPTASGCLKTSKEVVDSVTKTLSPCTYAGGIEIKNNSVVTFSAGVYIVKEKFTIDSNSVITGTGVGFYLTGANGTLDFDSNTSVTLSAPTSGPLAGLLFFQDRAYGGTHYFDSNNAAKLDGAIYMPAGKLMSNSNNQMGSTSTCLMIVVYQLEFNSNAGVDTSPDYSLCTTPPGQRKSRIVA